MIIKNYARGCIGDVIFVIPDYLYLFVDLNQCINDVRESINNIVITGKRQNESPMRLMSSPKLLQSVRVAHMCCDHIACVTSDRIWASGRDKLLLINTNLFIIERIYLMMKMWEHTVQDTQLIVTMDCFIYTEIITSTGYIRIRKARYS